MHANPALGSLDMVAQQLCISPRKIRDGLSQLGLSYRQLRQQFLHEKSKELLLKQQFKTEQIASILGYNDSANFRRAFKKRTGVAPTTFVSQH